MHELNKRCPERGGLKNVLAVVIPKASRWLSGCLMCLAVTQACEWRYRPSKSMPCRPVAPCPYIFLLLDAPTFLCSSSLPRQGTRFQEMATIKHDASRCDLYAHTDALPWLKWLTLSLNWAERDVTEDVSSHTTPPLWILFPIARESPANILSSAFIGLKLTSEWLATPGRREAQQERETVDIIIPTLCACWPQSLLCRFKF